MKPGISTHVFAMDRLAKRHLSLVKEAGFDQVELWGMRPHANWYDRAKVEELANDIKAAGLCTASFHLPFYTIFGTPEFKWVYFNHPDPKIRSIAYKMACHIVDICPLFDCDIVVLHGNGQSSAIDFESSEKRFRQMLDRFLPYCEKRNVRVAIENIMTPGTSTEALRKLMDDYDSDYLWICLDTGHAHIAENLPEAIKNCGERLLTTHIADNFGKADDHLAPYQGTIDWEKAMKLFRDHCPNLINLMFELYFPTVDKKVEDAAYMKTLNNAKKAWGRMKNELNLSETSDARHFEG